MVRDFVERWEDGLSNDTEALLLRTAVTNEAVAERVQEQFNYLIIEPIGALGDPHAARRGALVGAQLLGLALCRYILHLEPLNSLPTETVVKSIAPTIQRYLTENVDG